MKYFAIFVFLWLPCRMVEAQPVDPRAHSSVGIRRDGEDTVILRASGGIGVNAGWLNVAPLVDVFRLTRQAGSFFYGLGVNQSQSVSSRDTQQSLSDVELLFGYSWDEGVPRYGEPSAHVHFALATGIAIENYTLQVRESADSESFGNPRRRGPFLQTVTKNGSIGLPLQFSASYEFFRYLGLNAQLFYVVSNLQPSYGAAIALEARY
jgi:hypothetical protein